MQSNTGLRLLRQAWHALKLQHQAQRHSHVNRFNFAKRRGVAVAIDGQIYRDDWFRPIPPGSEVVILPRMAGG